MFEDLIKEIDRMNGKSVSVPIECDEYGYIDKQCPSRSESKLIKLGGALCWTKPLTRRKRA